jgi:hypothetical protein
LKEGQTTQWSNKEGQTTQWSNKKGQKDKQWSTKHYAENKKLGKKEPHKKPKVNSGALER